MLEPELRPLIAAALHGLDDVVVRGALSASIDGPAGTAAFASIEDSFRHVTTVPPGAEGLRWFFRSWSMTNNSAMCVSGLGNRISLQVRQCPDDPGALVDALTSLHRIADEDLGVGNALLHADLFYAMATALCGDDAWQSKRYLTSEAEAFKRWKDRCSLVDDDLVIGLLSTVVHEIYTHAEVELLWPLFDGWLAGFGWSEAERRRALRWVTVHCGGTELDHFGHAVDALSSYRRARDIALREDVVAAIAGSYLDHKAAAMTSIVGHLGVSDAGVVTVAIPS